MIEAMIHFLVYGESLICKKLFDLKDFSSYHTNSNYFVTQVIYDTYNFFFETLKQLISSLVYIQSRFTVNANQLKFFDL